MRFQIRPRVLLLLLSLTPAFGQGTKGPIGGTTSTTISVPSSAAPPGVKTPSSSLPVGFEATPQFVNGKVLMDDGAPPPEGVAIERVCGSITHTEGHTDQKGGFGFEMGHDDTVQDATYNGTAVINPNRPVISSDLGADPNRPYRNCDIRANLPGYRSEAISLSTYKPGENSNIGTILLHRMGNVEGSVISATSAAAPKSAVREYAKGLDEASKGKNADAVQSFGKAVQLYPQYSAAWLELGRLQMGMQQLTDAEKSFQSAIQSEPKFISPYLQLSQLDFQSRKWQQLADVTEQVLKLNAFNFPREYYYNGLANYTLKRMNPAEKSLRETIKLDTQNQFPNAHQFLAAILVTKHDINGAQEELRSYLKLAPVASDADNVRHQLDALERAAGPAGK